MCGIQFYDSKQVYGLQAETGAAVGQIKVALPAPVHGRIETIITGVDLRPKEGLRIASKSMLQ